MNGSTEGLCGMEFDEPKDDVNLFDKLQEVIHKKSGRIYMIYETPRISSRLEYNNEPYYQYKGGDDVWWIRCKSEMEDGRFEAR